jgi:hypothetical protein
MRPGREDDKSPLSSAEVKSAWSYTSTPQYTFTFFSMEENFFCQYFATVAYAIHS